MTKQEYKDLLESEYWRGFSFSLIKERNFTCEDCGAYYPNERNKLQVHHLVYRDISPWSYAPEEMVVLCKKCHEKRHGILHSPDTSSEIKKDDDVLIELNANPWDRIMNILCVMKKKKTSIELPKSQEPHYNTKEYRRYKRKRKPSCLFGVILFLFFLLILVCLLDSKDNGKKTIRNEQERKALNEKSFKKSKSDKNINTDAEIEIDPFQEVVESEDMETEIIEESEQEVNIQVESNPDSGEPIHE